MPDSNAPPLYLKTTTQITRARTTDANFQPKSLVIKSGIRSMFYDRPRFVLGDDCRAGFVTRAELPANPFDRAARFGRLHNHGSQKCTQFFNRYATHELAFVSV